VSGKVDRLSLVSTTILTFDNQKLIVPNRQIWGGVIRNKTSEALRRVDFEFSIGRRGDVPRAESICAEILKNHPLVLEDPAPAIIVNELAEWSVELAVRPWVKTENYWTVLWDVNRQANDQFEAENISRPSPERQVLLSQAS
jgi:small conductance mechanosensitive channel